jgi:hypothetical protein
MKNEGGQQSSSSGSSSGTAEAPVEGKVIPPKGADEGDGGAAGPSPRA